MEPLFEFAVEIALEVRWGDMDAFAHVNNTVYFRYFESARIAYFDRMGMTPGGVGPILASTHARFRAPLTHPDRVRVGARVVDVGEDRFSMEYGVWSERLSKVAATGEGLVVAFDYESSTKATLPRSWREAIASIEALTAR